MPKPRAVGLLSVCLTVKPVGEPDALIGHVRFDERGWETERCRMAQATAPILDSTKADNPVAPAFVRFWTKADKGWFSYSLHCLHGRACHLVGPRRNKARIFPKSHNCFILWALLFVYQHSGG